jgi:hypothetical protein
MTANLAARRMIAITLSVLGVDAQSHANSSLFESLGEVWTGAGPACDK